MPAGPVAQGARVAAHGVGGGRFGQQQRDLLETQANHLGLERRAFEAERRTSHEHMLAQEDRFHRLIDDARQELKQLTGRRVS